MSDRIAREHLRKLTLRRDSGRFGLPPKAKRKRASGDDSPPAGMRV